MSNTKLEKVLIIDDNADYRKLIVTFISKLLPGVEAVEYDPVFEGVPDDNFSWSNFDVLLLDYHLSIVGVTGLDILQKNHKKPTFPATIMLTGAGTEEIAIRALKTGIYEYLPKQSLTKDKLKQSIIHAWEAKKADRVKQQEITQHNRSFSKEVFYENLARTSKQKDAERTLIVIKPDNIKHLEEQIGIIGRDSLINHIGKNSFEIFKLGACNPNITRISDTEIAVQIDYPLNQATLEFNMQGLCKHLSKCVFRFSEEKINFTVSIGVLKIGLFDSNAEQLIHIASSASKRASMIEGNSYYIWQEADGIPEHEEKAKPDTALSPQISENKIQIEKEIIEAKKEKERLENELKAAAEAQAKAEDAIRTEQHAKKELEEQLKAAAAAREKAESDLKAASEAKIKAETEAKLIAEREAQEKLDIQLKAEAEAKAKAEMEAEIRAAKQDKERLEAEIKAKEEAEKKLIAEREAHEKLEAQLKTEAEAKARAEEEILAAKQAKEKLEAELKAVAEAKLKAEAELKAETEAKVRAEAEAEILATKQAKEKLEAELKTVAEAKLKAEAELKALAEEKLKAEAELKAENEAKAMEEAKKETKQKRESELIAEVKAKARAEAEVEILAAKQAKEKLEAEMCAIREAKEKLEAELNVVKSNIPAQTVTEQYQDKTKQDTETQANIPVQRDQPLNSKDLVNEEEKSHPITETNETPGKTLSEETENLIRKLMNEKRIVQTYQPVIAMFDNSDIDSHEIFKTGMLAYVDNEEINNTLSDISTFSIELQQSINEWILRQVFLRITESGTKKSPYKFLVSITEAWFSDIKLFDWLQKILTQTKKYTPGKYIILDVPLNLYKKHQKRALALINTLHKTHDFSVALSHIDSLEDIANNCSVISSTMLLLDIEQLHQLSETMASSEVESENEETDKINLLQYLKTKDIRIITSGIEDATLLTDAITAGTDYAIGSFVGEIQDNLAESGTVESFELT